MRAKALRLSAFFVPIAVRGSPIAAGQAQLMPASSSVHWMIRRIWNRWDISGHAANRLGSFSMKKAWSTKPNPPTAMPPLSSASPYNTPEPDENHLEWVRLPRSSDVCSSIISPAPRRLRLCSFGSSETPSAPEAGNGSLIIDDICMTWAVIPRTNPQENQIFWGWIKVKEIIFIFFPASFLGNSRHPFFANPFKTTSLSKIAGAPDRWKPTPHHLVPPDFAPHRILTTNFVLLVSICLLVSV